MSQDPDLGDKLLSKDVVQVRTFLMQRALRQHKSIFQRDQEIKKIWDNPDDEENQKKIAEMIRLESIDVAHRQVREITSVHVHVHVHVKWCCCSNAREFTGLTSCICI